MRNEMKIIDKLHCPIDYNYSDCELFHSPLQCDNKNRNLNFNLKYSPIQIATNIKSINDINDAEYKDFILCSKYNPK